MGSLLLVFLLLFSVVLTGWQCGTSFSNLTIPQLLLDELKYVVELVESPLFFHLKVPGTIGDTLILLFGDIDGRLVTSDILIGAIAFALSPITN